MLVYGLTGGIGSGKSTVAAMFKKQGLSVCDADRLGMKLLEPGTELSLLVSKQFPECTDLPGAINRKKLADLVFSDVGRRRYLEELVHPAIYREFLAGLDKLPRPRPRAYLIEGAVLLESSIDFSLAGLIVVTAPATVRIHRLSKRKGFTEEEIRARMAAQLPEHLKLLHATHVIDNGGRLADTRRQVEAAAVQLASEQGGKA